MVGGMGGMAAAGGMPGAMPGGMAGMVRPGMPGMPAAGVPGQQRTSEYMFPYISISSPLVR